MNSKSSNEKIIQILSEMEPIHDENQEEKNRRLRMEKEAKENLKEAPLAFARKAAGYICIGLWVFSIVALMLGFGDLGVLMPFMILGLGAVCGLNIPVFWKKGKIFDIVVAVAACAVCLIIALGLLFVGGR